MCPNCRKPVTPPASGRPWWHYGAIWGLAIVVGTAYWYYKPGRVRARREAEQRRVEQQQQTEAGRAAIQGMHEGLDRARQAADRAAASQAEMAERLKAATGTDSGSPSPTTAPAATGR